MASFVQYCCGLETKLPWYLPSQFVAQVLVCVVFI